MEVEGFRLSYSPGMSLGVRQGTEGTYMYEGREVFQNAPLELVAAEVRFTYVPGLNRDEAREKFAEALRDMVPVASLDRIQNVTIGEDQPPKVETDSQFRLMDRTSTLSVVLQPARLVVETTAYPQFERFRETLFRAIKALPAQQIGAVGRIGLRYIDEIRVPSEINGVRDWIGWIDSRLLAALGVQEKPVAKSLQGLIHYDWGDRRFLNFRFGAFPAGSALSMGKLKRRDRPRGPFFLLDLDSYWESGEEIEPFEVDQVVGILDDLHTPAGEVFVASITDKIREEVFRERRTDKP